MEVPLLNNVNMLKDNFFLASWNRSTTELTFVSKLFE